MRAPVILVLILAAISAAGAVCAAPPAENRAVPHTAPHWTLDHYIYDASLRTSWAVLVDCNHPQAPARMELAVGANAGKTALIHIEAAIKAGTPVEVSSATHDPASIHLSGTAMEAAFAGQPIRVRLNGGSMVRGYVRGPHSVQLIAEAKPSWGEQ